jgi:hypothetical protein
MMPEPNFSPLDYLRALSEWSKDKEWLVVLLAALCIVGMLVLLEHSRTRRL